jgi:hypothetical protein
MEHRRQSKLTPTELREAVKSALAECQSELAEAKDDDNASLARDLNVAMEALRMIDDEVSGQRPQRPKGQRSAAFIRYALDEGERMVMAPSLRDRIVEIEDLYSRM